MNEIWKDINGYEGFYQVSNYGRIKSLERRTKYYTKETILKQYDRGQSLSVVLRKPSVKPKFFLVHRLVISTFKPSQDNSLIVRHLDGNYKNNRLDNLYYGTYKENSIDLFMSSSAKQSKLTVNDVKEIKRILSEEKNISLYEIAKKYGVSYDSVWNIKSGRTWTYVE